MKFNNKTTKVNTNLNPLETINATIGDPSKIFKMFTKDLYKYPLQTAIQEYINNAKDAHIMANKDTSTIEITAPTLANQNVIIKDFGVGLSHDDVVNIFSNITASNKDNSDKFNGGFGIGSKSWFAVNPFFFVISNFNGIKTSYEVTFTDTIRIHVQSKDKTKEPNGLEVILPLSNQSQIDLSIKSIHKAIMFWEIQPKLINTVLNKPEYIFNCDDFKIFSIGTSINNKIKVTLGETEYSLGFVNQKLEEAIEDITLFYDIEFKFKIGELKLTNPEVGPDREFYTQEFQEALLQKMYEFLSNQEKFLKTLIKKVSLQDKLKIVHNDFFSKSNYEFTENNTTLLISKKYTEIVLKDFNGYYSLNKFQNHPIPYSNKLSLIIVPDSPKYKDKQILLSIFKTLKPKITKVFFLTDKEYNDNKHFFSFYNCFNLNNLQYSLPLTIEDKLLQKDPEVTIEHIGELVNKKHIFSSRKLNSVKKISNLNKNYQIINSSSTANINFSLLKQHKIMTYIVSNESFQIMKHFGFTPVDFDELKIKSIKINQEKKEAQKQRNERKLKEIEDMIQSESFKNNIQFFNLYKKFYYYQPTNPQDIIIKLKNFFPHEECILDFFNLKINFKELFDQILLCKLNDEIISKTYTQDTRILNFINLMEEKSPILYHHIFHKRNHIDDLEELQLLANHFLNKVKAKD